MTRELFVAATACTLAVSLVSAALVRSSQSAQANTVQQAESSFPVACSVDKPVVEEGGSVFLRAWAGVRKDETPAYVWTTTIGKISVVGQEGHWDFGGVTPSPRPLEATVRVTTPAGVTATCSVQVVVERKSQPIARGQETGRSFLAKGKNEEKKYGLYSYLLLGAPPTASNRERYVKTIDAFLGSIVEISALEDYIQRSKLNITYLPVVDVPTSKPSVDWILEHYDYARARALLNPLPGSLREGPYFISAMTPLDSGAAPKEYLFQDLSAVPANADLISWWVREFLNQAAQERFWEPRTGGLLVLKLRTTIAALAIGLPDVRKGLDTWISWVH
jgi:hypothetical protein